MCHSSLSPTICTCQSIILFYEPSLVRFSKVSHCKVSSFAPSKTYAVSCPQLRTTKPPCWPHSHNGLNVRSFTRNWCIGAPSIVGSSLVCAHQLPRSVLAQLESKSPHFNSSPMSLLSQFCSQRHSGHSLTSPSQGQMIRIYTLGDAPLPAPD